VDTGPTAFAAFEADARRDGYDEVIERRWAPGQVLATHSHPCALRLLVAQGEMWLRVGDQERHLGVGQGCALDAEAPHDERYGPEGATLWVARRHRGG
jgi:mannose-6-phosphate isomerase-like protein (cupin superfamily)